MPEDGLGNMNVVMLKGLPASGKTTLAKKMVEDGYKRVSKDDLRAMLDNGKYSANSEELILVIRDYIVWLAVANGYNVVVDDTNLNPKHEGQLRLLSDRTNAIFTVMEMDTTLEECIRRDKQREHSIGEQAIIDMYNKYIRIADHATKHNIG